MSVVAQTIQIPIPIPIPQTPLLLELPVENLKKPLVNLVAELALGGTTEHVVVNAVAQIIQMQILILVVPVESLKKQRADLVEVLVSAGTTGPVVVNGPKISEAIHQRVMVHVLGVNIGMVAVVKPQQIRPKNKQPLHLLLQYFLPVPDKIAFGSMA